MTGPAIAVRLLVGAVLLAGTVGSGPQRADQQRDLDLVASAQPSDLHPDQRDAVFAESVVGTADVRADLVAIGRPHLANPAWTLSEAAKIGFHALPWPHQYRSAKSQMEANYQRERTAMKGPA